MDLLVISGATTLLDCMPSPNSSLEEFEIQAFGISEN